MKICDPYFGPESLEALRLILEVDPGLRVAILTSRKHQQNEKVREPLSSAYQVYWKEHVCNQSAPETEIVVVGSAETGESPIHDRWWISEGVGLRLGTSFNSLGHRLTEISFMQEEEARSAEVAINRYLVDRVREVEGRRLRYELFSFGGE